MANCATPRHAMQEGHGTLHADVHRCALCCTRRAWHVLRWICLRDQGSLRSLRKEPASSGNKGSKSLTLHADMHCHHFRFSEELLLISILRATLQGRRLA